MVTSNRRSIKGDAKWLKKFNKQKAGKKYSKLTRIRSEGEYIVIKIIVKELCHDHSPEQLKKEVAHLVDELKPDKIIIDMSDVNYVVSTLIGTLVWIAWAARESGGVVCLISMNDRILELLKLCAIDQVMKIFSDIDTAKRML